MTPNEAPLRVLIVDDEDLARQRARRLLDRIAGNEIIGEAADGRAALETIEAEQPDVVLLDIQMPGVDGLRILEALDDPPAIIFSTAHEHHAVRAFELEAVDYLLKPYSAERLAKALDRVWRQFAAPLPREEETPSKPRIPAEDGLTMLFLETEQLACARIDEGVVFLLTTDGEKLIYAKTLNDLERLLPAGRFFRANRQAILNVKAIESATPGENGALEVRLSGRHREAVSRRRARHLKTRLGL